MKPATEEPLDTSRNDAPRIRFVSDAAGEPSQTTVALRDIVDGAKVWYLWGMLGWNDIRQRYRRSRLGPFWLTISMGVMIGSLGFLYSHLFKFDTSTYLPFISLGFIVWGLISGFINEGCNGFIMAGGIIKQVSLPLSVHAYRVVWRNLIVLAHNAVIYLIVLAVYPVWPGWPALLAIPALVLLVLNGAWVALVLGLISARFRDVPQIAASIVQVAFFLTPIIWMPSLLPDRALVLNLNPFYHFIELLREPLLGQVPALVSWLAVAAITVAGWLATLLMYRRFRRRIAYWV